MPNPYKFQRIDGVMCAPCNGCKKLVPLTVIMEAGLCHPCQKQEDSPEAVTEAHAADFEIEQLKHSVISDLHTLSARIGQEPTKKFVTEEFTNLPF